MRYVHIAACLFVGLVMLARGALGWFPELANSPGVDILSGIAWLVCGLVAIFYQPGQDDEDNDDDDEEKTEIVHQP